MMGIDASHISFVGTWIALKDAFSCKVSTLMAWRVTMHCCATLGMLITVLFVQISHQRLPFTTNYTTLGRYVGISILAPLTLINHNGEWKHNAATLGYTFQTL